MNIRGILSRRTLRSVVLCGIAGLFMLGSAWAGIGLTPVGVPSPALTEVSPGGVAALAGSDASDLTGDELLAGAAKIDIKPAPDASKGEAWVRDKAECIPQNTGDPNKIAMSATDQRLPWVENTSCLYMGGFGIGPSQPIIDWDDYDASAPVSNPDGSYNESGYGLWVRSAAFLRPDASGKMNALVLSILDGEGYFGQYDSMCPPEKACGIHDIQRQLGEELGLAPESFVFASTHAHSAMDFIGGWGGVPTWYMRQVAESMRESVRQAIADAKPAVLEAGEAFARQFNSERRDTYRSAEDPSLNWLRAIGRDGNVISSVGTFAAHATSFGSSATRAHADWPGVFAKRAEERFGGVGLAFEAGLGNMSARANGHGGMGRGLADLLPPLGVLDGTGYTPRVEGGQVVHNPAVRVKSEFWDHPVTNIPLGTLGGLGFFDRPFSAATAQVVAGKSGSNKPCISASPVSAHVEVIAAKIGNVTIATAPGEIFANWSNTIEESNPPITSLAIGQANDALGYMPQSFETDDVAREGPGFAGGNFFEYEDAYSIDRCFGDRALDAAFRLIDAINKGQ